MYVWQGTKDMGEGESAWFRFGIGTVPSYRMHRKWSTAPGTGVALTVHRFTCIAHRRTGNQIRGPVGKLMRQVIDCMCILPLQVDFSSNILRMASSRNLYYPPKERERRRTWILTIFYLTWCPSDAIFLVDRNSNTWMWHAVSSVIFVVLAIEVVQK